MHFRGIHYISWCCALWNSQGNLILCGHIQLLSNTFLFTQCNPAKWDAKEYDSSSHFFHGYCLSHWRRYRFKYTYFWSITDIKILFQFMKTFMPSDWSREMLSSFLQLDSWCHAMPFLYLALVIKYCKQIINVKLYSMLLFQFITGIVNESVLTGYYHVVIFLNSSKIHFFY